MVESPCAGRDRNVWNKEATGTSLVRLEGAPERNTEMQGSGYEGNECPYVNRS